MQGQLLATVDTLRRCAATTDTECHCKKEEGVSQPYVYLLCGLPFAGKTTLAGRSKTGLESYG